MIPFKKLQSVASVEVEKLIRSLPVDVRVHAEKLPVVYHDLPTAELADVEDYEDILGLFVGDSIAEAGLAGAGQPASILLFVGAIWDYSEGDWGVFREEVRTTFLHELGHYLGWDEEDLEARGLE